MAFRQRYFLFVFFVTSFCNGVIAVQVLQCDQKIPAIEFNMRENTKPQKIIHSTGFNCKIQSVTSLTFKPDEYVDPYFAITSEASNDTFSMIIITLKKSFDLLDQLNTAKNFWAGDCSITTAEGKKYRLTTRITVIDDNTQRPKFLNSLYEYRIPETFPENVSFTNIYGNPMVAYDKDYDKRNNELTFELLENSSNSNIFKVFAIRTTDDSRNFTVNLQLQEKLDFFESSKHTLTLIARDKDYETNVSVIIDVQSEKKPTPKFEQSKYHVNTNATQMEEGTIKIDPPIKATACYPHNEGCCKVKYKIDIDASDESAAKFQIDENAENVSTFIIKENPITNPYIENVIVVVLKAYLEENENQYSQVNLRIDVEPKMQTTLSTTTEAESSSEATTTPLPTTIISSTTDDNEITTTAANSIDSTTASDKGTTITSTSTTDSKITTENTVTDQTTISEEITTSNRYTNTVFFSTTIQTTEDHISTADSSVTDITGSSDETVNTAENSQTSSIITSSNSPVTASSITAEYSQTSSIITSSNAPVTTSSNSPVTTSSNSPVTTSSTTTPELTEEVRFPYDIYNVTVPNITYNTLVWTVSTNPCASYKLTNNLFQIDNITGDIIFIGNSLEHGKEIILEIEAYPYWNNSFLADTAQVIITVNFNMNKGNGFSQPYYKFSIKENELGTIEQSSEELRVRDKNVSYEITNCGDSSTIFSINSSTAMLSANEMFDYEVRSQYQLKIRFVEIGDTKPGDCEHIYINEAVVVINIEDVNEPPNFAKSNYPILGITPSTIEGSLLTSFKAEDQDGGDNGKLRFSLNQSSSTFDLDADGFLYLKQSSEEIWISLTAVVSDGGIPSMKAKKIFQVIYVKTDEIFILTIQRRKNTTKKSKRNLLSQELQETSIEEEYDNSENTADFLQKLSQKIGVHIGFIPQEMNELSDRIELYLFAFDNLNRKLTFEEIKEKFASDLTVNIKPKLGKQQDVKTEYEMTVIIILAVILAAIVVGLVGIFIFKKWSQGKEDLGTDGTETKEVSLADSTEGEISSNQKDNPVYNGSENTNEEYSITLPEEANENSHQSENGNLIQNSIHIKSNNFASNNESNNAKETNNTMDENTKNQQKDQIGNNHVGIYPKLSPMFAKLSDPDAMFTEPEPLDDYYQVDIPPEDYESNTDLYENKNHHYNPDNMLENEILVNDSDITSQNENILKNNSLLKDLHNDRSNDNTVSEDDVQPNVIETNDSPKQISSQKYSLTNETTENLENNQTETEFADDSMEEDKKNRNKRKSIVTFNEIPEVINLPSEEISSL